MTTFSVQILGLIRNCSCNGDGTMTVHAETINNTRYMEYEKTCQCYQCTKKAYYEELEKIPANQPDIKSLLDDAISI